jgi:hypothetical protein
MRMALPELDAGPRRYDSDSRMELFDQLTGERGGFFLRVR